MRPKNLQPSIEPGELFHSEGGDEQKPRHAVKEEQEDKSEQGIKIEQQHEYDQDDNQKSDSLAEAGADRCHDDNNEGIRKPRSPPRHPAAHYAPSHHPSGYVMPYGYMPPHMSPYGGPGMPYGMPGPYAQNIHAAALNGYIGYPQGFMWADPFGNPMYPGMTPAMTGPPQQPTFPNSPLTPTRSSGSDSPKNQPSEEFPEAENRTEEGKGSSE
jgi:hypothetical protein